MKFSSKAENILSQINEDTKLGDLRKIAKDIKKDHLLAMEFWSSGRYLDRQLSILIMDKKQLSQEIIDTLIEDMGEHQENERTHLMDWLMANQLVKDKKTLALIESWENSHSSLQRRTYWYHQGRLRWMGQPQTNNKELLAAIEKSIATEKPEVQWAMNFTAGWIGVFDKECRDRCIFLGEKTGLYKGKMVSKGCTPEYLPAFIAMESNKRNL